MDFCIFFKVLIIFSSVLLINLDQCVSVLQNKMLQELVKSETAVEVNCFNVKKKKSFLFSWQIVAVKCF